MSACIFQALKIAELNKNSRLWVFMRRCVFPNLWSPWCVIDAIRVFVWVFSRNIVCIILIAIHISLCNLRCVKFLRRMRGNFRILRFFNDFIWIIICCIIFIIKHVIFVVVAKHRGSECKWVKETLARILKTTMLTYLRILLLIFRSISILFVY